MEGVLNKLVVHLTQYMFIYLFLLLFDATILVIAILLLSACGVSVVLPAAGGIITLVTGGVMILVHKGYSALKAVVTFALIFMLGQFLMASLWLISFLLFSYLRAVN